VVVALDRRLVAVMFTDMAGYTALQADERLALDRRERYWDALERHHEAFGGTIVQRLGDGSMSMFPSSLAAVQAAVAVQQELAPQDMLVRIGVHSGEPTSPPAHSAITRRWAAHGSCARRSTESSPPPASSSRRPQTTCDS
jgi:class 3 adenylate cyclase